MNWKVRSIPSYTFCLLPPSLSLRCGVLARQISDKEATVSEVIPKQLVLLSRIRNLDLLVHILQLRCCLLRLESLMVLFVDGSFHRSLGCDVRHRWPRKPRRTNARARENPAVFLKIFVEPFFVKLWVIVAILR